jgi:hypothetical protein
MLAFRSLDPFRALREPDRRRRDEERLSRSEQRTLSKTQNNHLTGKAPYKFESISLQRRVSGELGPGSTSRGVHAWLGARGRETGSENTAANSGPLLIPRAIEQMDRCGRTRNLSPQGAGRRFEVKFLAPSAGAAYELELYLAVDVAMSRDGVALRLQSTATICPTRHPAGRSRFGGGCRRR